MNLGNSSRNSLTNNSNNNSRQTAQTHSIERAEKRLDSSNNDQARVIQGIVGQHNYTAQARQPAKKGLWAYLHKKLKPLISVGERFHEKARESSRFIRRIVNGALLGGMLIAIIGGHFAKIGITVPNTSVPSTKVFVNADTVKLTNEVYDTANHTMRLNITTKGESGSIGASQLTSKLEMAQAPKKHWFKASPQRPEVNLIPTFNDHFIIMIRHLYPDFDGLEVTLHNRANITPSSLNDAMNDSQNSEALSKELSGKQQDMLREVADSGVTNYKNGQQTQALIKKIEKHNQVSIIVREQTAKAQHKGYVNPDEPSTQIAMNALRHHLKFDYRTIASNKKLINIEKHHMKLSANRIRQVNRTADIGDKQGDLSRIRTDIQEDRTSIQQDKREENKLQKDVNTTLTLISRVNVHIAEIPRQQGKVKASIFHPDD